MAEQFRATVTPQGTGSTQAVEEAIVHQQKSSAWTQLFKVGVQAAQMTTAMTEQANKEAAFADTIKAQSDATKDMGDYSARPAQDVSDYFQEKRDTVIGGNSTNSQAYDKAYLATTNKMYQSSTREAKIIATDNGINLETSGMVNSDMIPEGYDYRTGLKYISDKFNVDPSRVRDSWMANVTGFYADQYSSVSDMDSLKEIDDNYTALRSTAGNPELFGSRSNNFKALDANNKAMLKQARTAAEKRIKTKSQDNIVEATGNTASSFTSYLQPYSAVEEDFNVVYGDNKITLDTKKQEYNKKHKLATASRLWQTQYNPGDEHTKVPADNKQLQAEWQTRVTDDLSTSFNEGKYESFVNIVNNEPKYSKIAGENIMTEFNNIQDPLSLKSFTDKVEVLSYQTNGATALRQSLGDDNYVNILATKYLSETTYAGDIVKARAAINVTDKNISEIPIEPGMKADVFEFATKLGKQGDKYVAMVQKLHAIDPSLAAKEYKNLADYFEDQREEKSNVMVDTSMTPYLDTISLDADRTFENYKDRIRRLTGADPDSIVMMGDTAMSLDNLSGIMSLTDMRAEAKKTNNIIEKEKKVADIQAEQARLTPTGGAAVALDTAGQVILGEGSTIVGKFMGSIGDVVSNLVNNNSGYAGRHYAKGTGGEDIKAWFQETFPSEATPMEREAIAAETINNFNETISTIVTEDPRTDIANNTMSPYDNETLSQVLQGNKHTKEVAKKLKKEFLLFQEGYLEPLKPEASLEDTTKYASIKDLPRGN